MQTSESKGTLQDFDSGAGFGFEVPERVRGQPSRNLKITALVLALARRWRHKSAAKR
jgi:hypothetical protein